MSATIHYQANHLEFRSDFRPLCGVDAYQLTITQFPGLVSCARCRVFLQKPKKKP